MRGSGAQSKPASIRHRLHTCFISSRRSSDSVEIQQAPQCEPLEPRLLLSAVPEGAWQTFIGGIGSDDAEAMAIANDGSIYVTGRTKSANWTQGGYDTTYNSVEDAFVAKSRRERSLILGSFWV